VLEKLFECIARVFILFGGNVGRAHFGAKFRAGYATGHAPPPAEIFDGIGKAFLGTRDAPELVMRVDLFVVNLNCPLESFARRFQLAALLVNQTKIVMRRKRRPGSALLLPGFV